MIIKGRPNWIAAEDQDAMDETARRVERYLKGICTGSRCPDRALIVEKMRREYAKHGRRTEDD